MRSPESSGAGPASQLMRRTQRRRRSARADIGRVLVAGRRTGAAPTLDSPRQGRPARQFYPLFAIGRQRTARVSWGVLGDPAIPPGGLTCSCRPANDRTNTLLGPPGLVVQRYA